MAVPVLIFHRRWRWLAAYASWMAVLLGISVWQAGWASHLQFWHQVLPSISCGTPVSQNSSIVAYVQELFLGRVPDWLNTPSTLPPHACAVSRLVALALCVLIYIRLYLRHSDADITRDLAIVPLLGIAISPISWWHHYTMVLLPLLYLWCKMPDKGNRTLLALFLAVATNVFGLSLVLTQSHVAQLILASIVPCLTITLVYRSLIDVKKRRSAVFH
jgi:hypothetical protein